MIVYTFYFKKRIASQLGRGLYCCHLSSCLLISEIEVLRWYADDFHLFQGIGCTKITKARNEGSTSGNAESRSYLEKKLVFCFGSYIAAQMLLPFGEENFLSSSELMQAQEVHNLIHNT